MKTVYKYVICSVVLFISLNLSLTSQDSVVVNKEKIKEVVKFLASDELKGRFPGTEGMRAAADYIENQFKDAGLKPLSGSYRQGFNVTTSLKPGDSNHVVFETVILRPGIPRDKLPKMKQPWKVSEDYVPLGFSENGICAGELAFVGFGITAPEINYDDYAGIDVKNKIVIMISDSPDGEKKDGEFGQYTDMRYKATNARNKGAIGIIWVRIQGDSMNVFERLDYKNIGKNTGIIAIQAWRQSISKFFPKKEALISLEEEIIRTRKPKSLIIPNSTVSIRVDLKDVPSETYNIYGFIEGTDPKLKEEFIVVGAHYDHLGFGGPTASGGSKRNEIYNGADDNASGVAGIIELANLLKANPPKRSILFIAFSGEEMGLLGSAWYIKHPAISLDKIVTMLNFDMIGRMKTEEGLTVFGHASATGFESVIDSISASTQLTLIKASDAYGPSDHSSFYAAKIPVLMFFTGIHEDYHRPTDDWNKINYDGMVKTINFSYKVLQTISNKDSKPVYKEITSATQPSKSSTYSNVWFGIVPNI
jgi:Zn-dependent M28 family amino/carboxypeptidase